MQSQPMARALNEESPLLQRDDALPKTKVANLRNDVKILIPEMLLLLRRSLPVIFAYFLQNSLQACSVLVAGRSSPTNLAAAAFAYMFAMCTGWLIGIGGTTALDTLASPAVTGSSSQDAIGVLLQRAFLVLGLMYIPVAFIWGFSRPIFLSLGQEKIIAEEAARFLRYLIPGGIGYIYFEAMKKYMQIQGIMMAGTHILIAIWPINIGLNILFCNAFNLDLIGAPIATGISYWLSFFALVLYAFVFNGHQGWSGWSAKAFQNLKPFTQLASLGILHVGAEWWSFEIITIAAGWLGTVPMASQSIIMSSDQVLSMIPFGISVATSNRVGSLLGAQDPKGTALVTRASMLLSVSIATVVMITLIASRFVLPGIFNGNAEVVRLTAEVLPYVAAFQIADGINGSCNGSFRGMGRQKVGAIINVISYYFIAVPLGIWLSEHGFGLAGLWMAQCLALYTVSFIECIIVARSDWEEEVERAFERMDVVNTITVNGPSRPSSRDSSAYSCRGGL